MDLSQLFLTSSPPPSHQPNPLDFTDFIVPDSQFPAPHALPLSSPQFMTLEENQQSLFVTQPDEGDDQQDAVGSEDELGLVDPLDETAGKFRLAAKSVFLTYPKCTLDKDTFVAAIEKFKFDQYYAVREDHKDGTPHYHVIGEWTAKKNIKNPRFFDIQKFHPNIGRTRNRLAAWRYVHKTKGRSTHVGGDMPEPVGIRREAKDDFWKEAVTIKDRDTFISRFRQEAPRDLIVHYSNVKAYADDEFKVEAPEYCTPELSGYWDLPEEITEWVEENIKNKSARPKSLCLYGETRLYKTIWARSLGAHCYMSGCWNARLLDDDKQYVVIDDVPLDDKDMFKHFKQMLGCQNNFSVTDKYVKKVHFAKWGLPCIYLANQDPREYNGIDATHRRWLNGNCVFVEVEKPLFVTSSGPGTPDSRREALSQFIDEADQDTSF
ncbi:replication initiation protein [Diaporthe pseudophoenicicola DNA virus 1]|nr:replication initiation protein [Diaporthe pseudophoenicicola DNA virus 1]